MSGNFCRFCGKPLDPNTRTCLQCPQLPEPIKQALETPQDILKQQVAAKAKQAVHITATTGNIAKAAFLATITEAKTVGEKAVVFGSLAGIVAFFLPWLTIIGTVSGSGLRLAIDWSAWFWLYPVSMAFCFVAAWFFLNADPQKRILAARWFVLIGTLWVGPGLAAVSNILSGVAGFGIYLALASAGAILIGGFLQISHFTEELRVTNV